MIVETERLRLRPSRLADVPALYAFLGDAEAMRFTHVAHSLRDCRRRVAVHEYMRRRDGCAPWVVVEKAGGEVIGWGGLYDDPFDRGWGIELGYWFHPSAWGRGFGSELAQAAMREADERLRLPKLSAFARPENFGSWRVLEKVGFRKIRHVPEMERDLFERTRPGS